MLIDTNIFYFLTPTEKEECEEGPMQSFVLSKLISKPFKSIGKLFKLSRHLQCSIIEQDSNGSYSISAEKRIGVDPTDILCLIDYVSSIYHPNFPDKPTIEVLVFYNVSKEKKFCISYHNDLITASHLPINADL